MFINSDMTEIDYSIGCFAYEPKPIPKTLREILLIQQAYRAIPEDNHIQ